MQYNSYKRLIAKRAWAWTQRTGLEFEELVAEGNLIFVQASNSYDPEKGMFSTYLWWQLENRYKAMINYHNQSFRFYINSNILPDFIDQENQVIFSDYLSKKSIPKKGKVNGDARAVINLALNLPDDFVNFARQEKGTVRVTKKLIQRYLIQVKGWGIGRCWTAFKMARTALA